MEERERMLDTIMEMQKWNGIKDEQIETLEQENQVLKDRWQKLKEHIIELCEDYHLGAYRGALDHILEKIQELEKE